MDEALAVVGEEKRQQIETVAFRGLPVTFGSFRTCTKMEIATQNNAKQQEYISKSYTDVYSAVK